MGKSDELQRQTLRVLALLGLPGKPLSARAAGEKLEIGYNQIADMAKGKTPAEKTLIKFAHAVQEDPSAWLRYAGKHEFARTLDTPGSVVETDLERTGRMIAAELGRVPVKQQATLIRQVLAVIRAVQEPVEKKIEVDSDSDVRHGGVQQ